MKKIPRRSSLVVVLSFLACLSAAGCMFPTVKLFTDASDPLKEFTIEGKGREKIAMIPVSGLIHDISKKDMIRSNPSMVQDVVAQLRLAEKDDEVKAVMLKIESPGGSVTASDILYHEIKAFKERSGKKVTAVIMNVAASGGYYIALPADWIIAHPTSVTGSVGVIFLRPQLFALMDKIGVEVAANTSGENKDMGSPFRKATADEEIIFQELTDNLGKRFVDLVAEHRKPSPEAIRDIATARVYLASQALGLGLIDDIGYIADAADKTRQLAGLSKDSRIIAYRREEFPDDNVYNSFTRYGGGHASLVDLGLPGASELTFSGFYYLWPAGVNGEGQ